MTTYRCPAEYLLDARPLLAPVGAARLAKQPEPVLDWQCVRRPHETMKGPTNDLHIAMPLGVHGRSFRFGPELVQPPRPAGDATEHLTRMLADGEAVPPLAVQGVAHPAPPAGPVEDLVDQLARRGAAAIRVTDGDELLLLMPDAGEQGQADVDKAAESLAALFPTVTFLILQGITGAVAMPRRPAAPAPTPAYVHRLLDTLLDGAELDFNGQPIPDDVRDRLDTTLARYPHG